MKKISSLIFVNSGMSSCTGHDYSWNTALQSACKSRNIHHTFLFRKEISPCFLKEFSNSYAALTNTIYTKPFINIEGDPYNLFIQQAEQIKKDFKNLKIDIHKNTLMFCHTADPATMLGMLWWCATMPAGQQPTLLFHFHYSFSPLGEWATQIFTEIRKALSPISHVYFCACIDFIASFLTYHLHKEVTLLPMPFNLPDISNSHNKIVYGFAGGGRLEQGPALLAPLALEYIKRGGKNNFIFQVAFSQQHPDIASIRQALENAEQLHPQQIQFIPQLITGEKYYDLLAKYSLLLLPYDSLRYHNARPSQIVQESIAMGIPALVPNGGSLAYEVTKAANGSIITDDLNVHTLCDALFTFEETAEKRLQQAKASRDRYIRYNNIDNIMQFLLHTYSHYPEKSSHISIKNNLPPQELYNKNTSPAFHERSVVPRQVSIESPAVLKKYWKKYYKMLSHSILFNAHYYLTTNPDVYAAGMDPLLHFVRHGGQEGRKPNPIFDPEYYLAVYPDVAEAGMNPLCHYIEYGWKEERNPSAQFNTLEYLENNEDVRRANMNPLEHFLKYGLLEGRNIN